MKTAQIKEMVQEIDTLHACADKVRKHEEWKIERKEKVDEIDRMKKEVKNPGPHLYTANTDAQIAKNAERYVRYDYAKTKGVIISYIIIALLVVAALATVVTMMFLRTEEIIHSVRDLYGSDPDIDIERGIEYVHTSFIKWPVIIGVVSAVNFIVAMVITLKMDRVELKDDYKRLLYILIGVGVAALGFAVSFDNFKYIKYFECLQPVLTEMQVYLYVLIGVVGFTVLFTAVAPLVHYFLDGKLSSRSRFEFVGIPAAQAADEAYYKLHEKEVVANYKAEIKNREKAVADVDKLYADIEKDWQILTDTQLINFNVIDVDTNEVKLPLISEYMEVLQISREYIKEGSADSVKEAIELHMKKLEQEEMLRKEQEFQRQQQKQFNQLKNLERQRLYEQRRAADAAEQAAADIAWWTFWN